MLILFVGGSKLSPQLCSQSKLIVLLLQLRRL